MLRHRSPALTAIYNEIKNSDRNRVLDLGAMNAGCFDLFSNLSCKIQVEDITTRLREHITSKNSPENFDCGLDKSLGNYDNIEKFDVILAWDLFNYLDLKQIEQLFDELQEFCKPNTLLYMLRYVEKTIPVLPREIRVKDQYILEFLDQDLTERQVPHYGTLQLLKSLPGYYMQDTLLGQTGMLPGVTEHVLRFSPSFESRHLISKSESSRKIHADHHLENKNSREHNSPSIAEVMSLLQSDDNCVVLDLGSAINRPEDRIVEKSGEYFRLDLFSVIERAKEKHTETLNLSVLNKLMAKRFDVILAWDLFNYCTPNQIRQIDMALRQLCHEDTFMLTYMYTNKNKPVRPSRFELGQGNNILVNSNSALVEMPDAVTGVAMLRLLNSFVMDKTYAYRIGMDREIIEYIFAYNQQIPVLESPEGESDAVNSI